METQDIITKRFEWFKKDDELWLGVIEVNGIHGMETIRVKIETQTQSNLRFSHYKFERFDYNTRRWTMDTIQSNYPLFIFITIREKYFEHISETNPENILITFKAKDQNRERRMKVYRSFSRTLQKMGYEYIENDQPTYSALLSYKNENLIQMKSNGNISDFLNTVLSYIKFNY